MNKNCLWLALPAAVISIAFAQPAAASSVTYTFAGLVDVGQDDFGLFGTPGALLNGAAFTAVFTRDDALADPTGIYVGDINSYVAGSEAFQPVTGVVTINGVSFDVSGDSGEQSQYDDGVYEGFELFASGLGGAMMRLGGTTLGTFAPTPGDVLAGPDYHTLTSLSGASALGFDLFGDFEYLGTKGGFQRSYAHFDPRSLTVSPAPGGGAGVPEPTSWALMIAGFGGVGWTLRRRRGAVAFA